MQLNLVTDIEELSDVSGYEEFLENIHISLDDEIEKTEKLREQLGSCEDDDEIENLELQIETIFDNVYDTRPSFVDEYIGYFDSNAAFAENQTDDIPGDLVHLIDYDKLFDDRYNDSIWSENGYYFSC